MGGGRWGVDAPGLLSAPPGPGGKLGCQRQKRSLQPPATSWAAPPSLGLPPVSHLRYAAPRTLGAPIWGAGWQWEVLGGNGLPCIRGLGKPDSFMSQGRPLLKFHLSCSGPKRGGGDLGHQRTAWNNTAARERGAPRWPWPGGWPQSCPFPGAFLVATEDQFG